MSLFSSRLKYNLKTIKKVNLIDFRNSPTIRVLILQLHTTNTSLAEFLIRAARANSTYGN